MGLLPFFQWGLIELARHPEVHAKLRAELRTHLGDQDPTYDQLVNGLPYLDAFTSEVFRLRPAAGEVTRVVSYHILLLDIYPMFTLADDQAVENDILPLTEPIVTASGTSINSLFIAKGTSIRVPVAGVNRSEALWGSDADKFNPERWLVSDTNYEKENAKREKIQGYRNLLTFALGPRVCIGKNFALTEFKVSFVPDFS